MSVVGTNHLSVIDNAVTERGLAMGAAVVDGSELTGARPKNSYLLVPNLETETLSQWDFGYRA
jgi:hypothetical protein